MKKCVRLLVVKNDYQAPDESLEVVKLRSVVYLEKLEIFWPVLQLGLFNLLLRLRQQS